MVEHPRSESTIPTIPNASKNKYDRGCGQQATSILPMRINVGGSLTYFVFGFTQPPMSIHNNLSSTT